MGLIAVPDAATLAEKLRPPRALTALDGALVAEPAPGSTTAWLAWCSLELPALATAIGWARSVGATHLAAGGPPGNYIDSGVPTDDAAWVAALCAAGFVAGTAHVDLRVSTEAAPSRAEGVAVERCADGLLDAVRLTFGAAWAWEAERAQGHGGLFAARADDGALLGFAAHSGNLAHRGTFGPIGVLPAARGRGVGAALAATVLADLRARGFDEATVPWVAPETVAFYGALATITARAPRVAMRLDLANTDWP